MVMDEPDGNLNFIIKINAQEKTYNKHILFDIYLLPNISSHLATSSQFI